MADSGSLLPILVIDHIIRRYILPLILLAAALLRYNVFSFIYLILFLVGVVIPGPRLKSQRFACVAHLIIVVVSSLLFALSQAGFQISIVTSLSLESCDTLEVILRQIGFIQYDKVSAVDVVRHLLPDIIVLIISLISVGVAIKISLSHTSNNDEDAVSSIPTDDPPSESELSALSHPVPIPVSSVQSYFKLPKWVLVMIDILIFFLILLCGVTVPSISSVLYYITFIVLSVSWSLHFQCVQLIRVIRMITLVYSAGHILILYLYQFQSAQLLIPVSPQDTTESLLARLFGLTPIIQTLCDSPTELLVWEDIPTAYIINPWALIGLYWILGIDCQLWLTTPKPLWSTHQTYCVPKLTHSSDTIRLSERGRLPVQHYGAVEPIPREQETETSLSAVEPLESEATTVTSKQAIFVTNLWTLFINRTMELWELLMSVNYVFSIVAMMVWSVLYPSWPALILLLWAVVIWIIPRIIPKQSLYYSSPVLVLYSLNLLILGFIESINVTEEVWSWRSDVGRECEDSSWFLDCLSLTLGTKSLLSLTFFASLREFVKLLKIKRKGRDNTNAQGEPLLGSNEEGRVSYINTTVLYAEAYLVLSTYWIIVVLGAFLMVILIGDPSALKSVYLLCLFIFFIIYQVFRKWWTFLMYPLWCILLIYAVLHLVLIYTFQFDVINDLWYKAYNKTDYSSDHNFTVEEVFSSVGFERYQSTGSRSLFAVLVPPAVFVAVIALQLRYFTGKAIPRVGMERVNESEIITRIISQFASNFISSELELGDIEREVERTEGDRGGTTTRGAVRERNEEEDEDLVEEKEEEEEEEVKSKRSKSLTFSRVLLYILVKLRQLIVAIWHIFWRFSELHTHKCIVISLFAFGLYEASLSYLILIICIVLTTPFQFLNRIVYPVVTIYLGALSIAKFLFQLQVVSSFSFNIKNCNDSSNLSIYGTVYDYTFSSQDSDSSWLGLNKAQDTATYVSGLILVALLICFWYSSKRHQQFYYEDHDIYVNQWEVGALFLGVKQERAHKSVIEAIKYLINHLFSLHGVEICFIFEAILIAVRIDVYGIIYACILGLMLMIPRSMLSRVWFLFLIIHGCLLIYQYAVLVGMPPSALCEEGYPWDDDIDSTRFDKWFFLPHFGAEVLNRALLYGDIFTYIMISLQMRNFISNPITYLLRGNHHIIIPNMYRTRYILDYIKILIFQYSFWLALFILFVTAATRLSLFGLLYLLLCFIFLYRGQNLLTDPRRTRIKWWSCLRFMIWFILLVRNSIQLVGCVFADDIFDNPKSSTCFFVSVFNIRCVQSSYYGVSDEVECANGSENVTGLWLDFITFVFVSVQLLIVGTEYGDQVQNETIERQDEADNFAIVMKQIREENSIKSQMKEDEDIKQLQERAEHLKLTEKRIDLFLHAGVRVPSEYITSPVHKKQITSESHSPSSPTHPSDDELSDEEFAILPDDAAKIDTEDSKLKRFRLFLLKIWFEIVDYVINFLESSSADYREVISRLKRARYQSAKDALLATVPPLESHETTPTSSYVHVIREDDDEDITDQSKQPKPEPPKSSSHGATSHFDESGDTLIDALHVVPTNVQEQEAEEVGYRLEEVTRKYTERPKRFLYGLYYWFISHFEYVPFFFVVIAVASTGAFTSFIYAGLLFLWGLLSIPWPTKQFWQSLMFYTMLVLIMKYVYQFFLLSVLDEEAQLFSFTLGVVNLETILAWVVGVQSESDYFTNAIANLLLLMTLVFHRGLLKQYGLWRTTTVPRKQNLFKRVLNDVKSFFRKLVSSDVVSGRKDYYIAILTCDVLCFLTIVFGYSYFSVGIGNRQDLTQVAQFIQTNNVPVPFLVMLFLQFISMLIDRAIYIRHSSLAKLIFYFILLLGWHLWLLIILPIITDREFVDNPAAQLIYFFKSGYFIFSALQLISGYPTRILGYFIGSSYSTISGLIFTGYRLIPLLPELREVMDWIFTDTSLSLLNWLRVQEIWSDLYKVKVRREREKNSPRDLGEKQGIASKLLQGGALLVALVLLIWGPLFVMSFVNQSSVSNPPISGSISIRLEGIELLQIQAQNPLVFELTSQQYSDLRSKVNSTSIKRDFQNLFRSEDFRRILFPGDTSVLWTASPPSQKQLVSLLNKENPSAMLTFSWSLKRSPSTGLVSETVTGSYVTNLTSTIQLDALENFVCNLNGTCSNSIEIEDLYPLFIYATATSDSNEFEQLSDLIPDSRTNSSINLEQSILEIPLEEDYSNVTLQQWWTIESNSDGFLPSNEQQVDNALEIIVYSERVAPPIFSFLSSFGIIGLYVSVVLVISRFIRSFINELPQNLLVDGILKPDPLLELCDDIFTVRETKNFILEEILVGKLFYIFRSPERLIEITDNVKIKTE